MAQVAQAALNLSDGAAVAVDPVTLGLLMRVYFNGSNDDRVSYVADTLPALAACGAQLQFAISIRNDGWNVLGAAEYKVKTAIVSRSAIVLPAAAAALSFKQWSSPFVPASSLSARLHRQV